VFAHTVDKGLTAVCGLDGAGEERCELEQVVGKAAVDE